MLLCHLFYTEEKNFCDFLFVSLDEEPLKKGVNF